uniref:Retrotransposon protein, putative, Ty3-gypsy subclass n=1 Tax=Oryza sativa subsp. japonica TaxID=39947 RepID=Q6I5W2_ORYSJ|nr:hypothetical protein [Oryza sativa Japonica Group]
MSEHGPREVSLLIRLLDDSCSITEIVYDLDHSEDYARFSTGTIYSSKYSNDYTLLREVFLGARHVTTSSKLQQNSIAVVMLLDTLIDALDNAMTLMLIKERELEALSDQANRQRSLLPTHPRLHRATDQANGHLFTFQGTAGIATFTRDLRRVDWPADFNPAGIEKYGGKTDPESWLTIYTLAIRAAGGDSKAMANYLPVALTDSTRSWPLGLRDRFVANFQGTYERPGIQFDVYHVIQLKNKLLKDFIRRFFETCNKIPEDTNNVIIVNFQKGIRDENLIGKFTRKPPLTVMKLFKTANSAEAINIVREDKQSSAPHLVKDNNEYHKKDRNRRPGNLVATTSYCQSHCPSARNYNRILNGPSPNHPNSKHPAKD